jgi:drug/metabolite transporter (DMT)-like permease
MQHESPMAYWWMLGAAFAFSVMSFLTHLLQHAFAWQVIASVRAGVALVLMLALARAARTPLVVWRPATLWIRSLSGTAALLANFYSLTHYPVPEVLALSTMFPLWVAILSWPVLGERPPLACFLAAVVGIAGVFVLQQPQAAKFSLIPVVTAFSASLFSAIAMLGLHRLRNIHTTAVVAHFSAVSLLACLASLWLLPWQAATATPTWREAVWLCGVGLSATAGQLFLTKAFAAGPPARVSIVNLVQIVFTMLLDMLLLSRTFEPLSLLGFALILGPTAWVLLSRAPRANRATAE